MKKQQLQAITRKSSCVFCFLEQIYSYTWFNKLKIIYTHGSLLVVRPLQGHEGANNRTNEKGDI